jgi:hypothetical protein
MRTTLNLEDEVLGEVKEYARERSLGLGKAVSQLLRRGLAARTATRTVNGLQVFDLPPDSPTVTTEDVRRLESQEG